jgi:AcrR family transcriptional regulator
MKQGEKTKHYILDESNKLFYKNGYNSSSFSDIVKETGLSKGNLTYHFKNKKAILEGIIAKRMLEIEGSFKAWEEQSENPKQRLLLFCDMIVGEQENIESFGCPMGTLTAEFSKNEPELYALTLPMFSAYRQWLKEQFEALDFDNPDEEAMSLLGKVQGVAMVTHGFKDKKFLLREIEKIKKEVTS